MRNAPFANRAQAGERLAELLLSDSGSVVVGIARGGVMVAEAVASALRAPLDLVVIRKVGHPLQPELALGAISASGESVVTAYGMDFDEAVLRGLFEAQAERARNLEAVLRAGAPARSLAGASVIIVDDGIATSASMTCAAAHARREGAARIVCAVPVAPNESIRQVRAVCDDVRVVIASHHPDFAVGRFYADFREVADGQVIAALARNRASHP